MRAINLRGSFGAALASAILQGATIVSLFVFKKVYPAEAFASLINVMAWASFIGAGATFRLELLLLQRFKEVNKSSLLVTFAFAVGVVSVATILLALATTIFGLQQPALFHIFALSLGYGMIEAQAFLSVHLNRSHELVYIRLAQALGISFSVLLSILGWGFSATFSVFSLSIAIPGLIWVVSAVHRAPGRAQMFLPDRHLLVRGASLTVATTVNTLYVSMAIIVAGQTQTASFVADFGFAQKLLSGPITFIRHFYSHAYLTRVLQQNSETAPARKALWRDTRSTVLRSMGTYFPFAIVVVLICVLAPNLIGIENQRLAVLLAIVTVFQSGVNSIAGVRAPLKRERPFLVFDVVRLVVLSGALLSPIALGYDIRFSIVSSVLYMSYLAFVRQQIFRS